MEASKHIEDVCARCFGGVQVCVCVCVRYLLRCLFERMCFLMSLNRRMQIARAICEADKLSLSLSLLSLSHMYRFVVDVEKVRRRRTFADTCSATSSACFFMFLNRR